MDDFLEVRVNDIIEWVNLDTVGGPSFNTSIHSYRAGQERRNINWSQARGNWDFGERRHIREDIEEIHEFFMQVAGQAVGFRFKDWLDYRTSFSKGNGIAVNVAEHKFQLHKRYGSGTVTRLKQICKPVDGTVNISVNGVLVPEAVVDPTTGIVTVVAASDADVRWEGEFDLPARFGTDDFRARFDLYDEEQERDMFWLMTLPVVELKPEEVEP